MAGNTGSETPRARARPHPKGRSTAPQALAEVRALLGDHPRERDRLIEHLHLIQDAHGHLSARHLAALAEEMRLSQAEVYEVATFYAHFDVVDDDGTPPPPITVRVCDSLSCALAGADRLRRDLAADLDPSAVRVIRAPCLGRCADAPAVAVRHRGGDAVAVAKATAPAVAAAVAAGPRRAEAPPGIDYRAYVTEYGGYRLLVDCLDRRHAPEGIIARLERASLRGLGGAGFPAARKWRHLRDHPGPRLMAVNADEGEPGTFKDRHLLESNPHQVLEGMLVAAWAVGADAVYIYLRDEYPHIRHRLQAEIATLHAEGLDKNTRIHLRRGAGAYICGEETAMLESLEGKRGLPRHKPPYPVEAGLFGRPTLIHNVETLYWLRPVLEQGGDGFKGAGRHGHSGQRLFSVSGRVREPGVKLAPAGITAAELIEEFCGGMAPGHRFAAYLPGGASGGILPASMADIPLDFGTLEPHGCFIGSAAMVVLSDQDDLRAVVLNLMRFFADESCGQCTPCRVGTEKMVHLLERPDWDGPLLAELAQTLRDASICGLGQAAGNPVLSVLRRFASQVACPPAGGMTA